MPENQAAKFVGSILAVEEKIRCAAVRTIETNDVGTAQIFADGSVLCRYADSDFVDCYASAEELEGEARRFESLVSA